MDGDLDAGYEGGTDHGDADLDGAIYSLYVSESNSFDVDYLEGTLDGVMFWAQPLSTGGYRVIWDADNDAANGFTDEGTNAFEDYPHAYVSGGKLYLDYTNEAGASAEYAAHTKPITGFSIRTACTAAPSTMAGSQSLKNSRCLSMRIRTAMAIPGLYRM